MHASEVIFDLTRVGAAMFVLLALQWILQGIYWLCSSGDWTNSVRAIVLWGVSASAFLIVGHILSWQLWQLDGVERPFPAEHIASIAGATPFAILVRIVFSASS
ncbi:hypothetical protein [Celeribacter litoreus]|uniref:hypothetical protein n=1 Tax=Celeribacter litoreus TaxID=2876714 RepID=UPI001CCE6A13|nr:hypothetical protein [Celeribacter litoreus]